MAYEFTQEKKYRTIKYFLCILHERQNLFYSKKRFGIITENIV